MKLIELFAKNKTLILEMAKRDIRDRFVGQVFGLLWFFIHSMFTMLVYIFLFSFVYKMSGNKSENYPLYLLSGLVPWMFLTETMSKSVSIIISNASLVKQVVFPIEVLPIKIVLSTLVSLSLNLFLLTLYSSITVKVSPIIWLLPIIVLFLFIFSLGVVFILSAVGTYLKDLKDMVQIFTSMGIYLLPIVYFENLVPGILRPLINLNPLTYLIYCFQDLFFYQGFNHPTAWIVFPMMSVVTCLFGFSLFTKFKLSFGNFL